MAFDFPASPTVGQEFVSGGITYVYNGTGWAIKGGTTSDFVVKTGDTMSGDLDIQPTAGDARLRLNKAAGAFSSVIAGRVGTSLRWLMVLGNPDAETGNNAGSDFHLANYSDAGAPIGTPLKIVRSTGQVLLNGVPAAPLNAMAYSGMQVNGSMEVSQEVGSSAVGGNLFPCDGWAFMLNGPTVICERFTGTMGSVYPGNNVLVTTVSVAKPSLAAGDYCIIRQSIEGYRVVRLNWGTSQARPITIGFWVGHSRAGIYSGNIKNFTGTRSFVFTYTQDADGSIEYKTVTIPGCTDGAWEYTNGVGMYVTFAVAVGSSFTTPSTGVWLNGSFTASVSQTNAVATTSDRFRLTHVVVLPGTQAPTAAQSPLIMRPYDQELVTCQRYYQHIDAGFGGVCVNPTTAALYSVFPVPMRAFPTVSLTTTTPKILEIATAFRTGVSSAINVTVLNEDGCGIEIDGFSGLTPLRGCVMVGDSGSVKLDARL